MKPRIIFPIVLVNEDKKCANSSDYKTRVREIFEHTNERLPGQIIISKT